MVSTFWTELIDWLWQQSFAGVSLVMITALVILLHHRPVSKSEKARENWRRRLNHDTIGTAYRSLMGRVLDWVDGKLTSETEQTQGPARVAWSRGLLNLTMLLAVAYPVLAILGQWLLGGAGEISGVVIIPAASFTQRMQIFVWLAMVSFLFITPNLTKKLPCFPLFFLAAVLLMLGGVVFATIINLFAIVFFLAGLFLGPLLTSRFHSIATGIKVSVSIAVSIAVAVAFKFSGSVTFANNLTVSTTLAVAVAFSIAFTVSVAGAIAGQLTGPSSFTVALAIAVAVAVTKVVTFSNAGTGGAAFAAAFVFATVFLNVYGLKTWELRSGKAVLKWLLFVLLQLVLITALVLSNLKLGRDEKTYTLFLVIFPLFNAVADFASVGLTRWRLRMGLERGGFLGVEALIDALGAIVIFALLGMSLIAYITFVTPRDGVPLLDLAAFFTDLQAHRENYGWLGFMLASTLLPTLLHLVIAALAFFTIFPARLRDWVHAGLGHAKKDGDAQLGLLGQLGLTTMIVLAFWVPVNSFYYGVFYSDTVTGWMISCFAGFHQWIS